MLRLLIVVTTVGWAVPVIAQPAAPNDVVLRHVAIERAAPNEPLTFSAAVNNCADCSVVVYTRTRGRSFFGRLPMQRGPSGHLAVLPASETQGDRLHYYIEVKNSAGAIVARSARLGSPHVVVLDPALKPAPPPHPTRLPAPTPHAPRARTASECELGPQLSYIRYEEPGLMEEAGMMMGVSGSCTMGERTYARTEGRFSFGWIDYDGRLMTGESYQVSNNFNTLFEVRGLVGHQVSGLGGYAGVGYRRLFDGFGHDPAGYDRTSQYFYSPVGVRLSRRVRTTVIEAHAEYRHFWTGRQRSNLSDVSPSLPDVTNKQRKGYGWNLGAGVAATVVRGWRIEFQPYVSYWSIEDSDSELVGTNGNGQPVFLLEPKNNSLEIGFTLASQF